ncbi:MAG: bifunctional UDP-N-acetylglucosamine diphosphorylase/glucosamine-1-phosphate N-acetyltransferase GlmU [Gammaproteobacteria bacterium]|nr:bifunctional UDP-N-acetylglucosamine diphosphorylase/glucosamine-1-phosphate N-acetyltransferase GlmU [Gammaproteobacteria bacterium]
MNLHIIILAAGKGQRMFSKLPKVLHQLAGKPLLQHVIETAQKLNPKRIHVVYGNGGTLIPEQFSHYDVEWIHQAEQLGTADAVRHALPSLPDIAKVLILYGDVPLISLSTLEEVVDASQEGLCLLMAEVDDPTGLGRIIRDAKDEVVGIVEEKDATQEQLEIDEVYSGILATTANYLKKWLPQIEKTNQQKEFYLTDVVRLAVKDKLPILDFCPYYEWEIMGINNRSELAVAERIFQITQAERLMKKGVTIFDPERFDLRGQLEVGQDVTIDVNVIIEGKVKIGNDCIIESGCVIRNAEIGDRVHIKAYSHLDDVKIENECQVGPFARLRPGTQLATGARIGNFVEVKNTKLGANSKANHLTYLGDATIGDHVNIGAGTITCNYDGANKFPTIIEDYAFIGSNTELVAPLTIGSYATIGAGSTITKDAPPHQLTLTRGVQKSIEGWKRPEKN